MASGLGRAGTAGGDEAVGEAEEAEQGGGGGEKEAAAGGEEEGVGGEEAEGAGDVGVHQPVVPGGSINKKKQKKTKRRATNKKEKSLWLGVLGLDLRIRIPEHKP